MVRWEERNKFCLWWAQKPFPKNSTQVSDVLLKVGKRSQVTSWPRRKKMNNKYEDDVIEQSIFYGWFGWTLNVSSCKTNSFERNLSVTLLPSWNHTMLGKSRESKFDCLPSRYLFKSQTGSWAQKRGGSSCYDTFLTGSVAAQRASSKRPIHLRLPSVNHLWGMW